MKRLLFAFAAMVLSLGLAVGEAEAANRVGGGKNVGSQRDGVSQKQATPPAASSAAAGAAAAPRSGMSRWLAPLAGLAAGLGLAYLLGDQLGSVMMALLIAVAVIFAIRFFMARRAGPQTAAAGAGMGGNVSQYSGVPRSGPVAAPSPITAGLGGGAAAPSAVPADFDVNGFLAQSKQAFMTLQDANDRGDLEAVRDMTTDEMFTAIKGEFDARQGAKQHVEVVTLNAEMIEVVTERGVHWASVRFSGSLREDAAGAPERFTEIWNLQKPVDGSAGWMLAGIQQVN